MFKSHCLTRNVNACLSLNNGTIFRVSLIPQTLGANHTCRLLAVSGYLGRQLEVTPSVRLFHSRLLFQLQHQAHRLTSSFTFPNNIALNLPPNEQITRLTGSTGAQARNNYYANCYARVNPHGYFQTMVTRIHPEHRQGRILHPYVRIPRYMQASVVETRVGLHLFNVSNGEF